MTMLLLCLLLGATTGLICDQDPCAFGGYHCANTYPAANPHNLSVLEVAAVFPFENTNGWTAVYKIAMDDVNDDPGIFPGYLKRIRWMSTRSDATHATAAFLCTTTADTASLLSPPTVPLILHSGYSFEVVAFSTLANLMSLPILSGTASSSSLSDRKAYPLFNRLFPPDNLQGRAIIQIVAHFKWKQICILAASDPASSLLMDALLKEAKSSNVVVVQAMQFDPNTSPEPQLQRILSSGVRIIIAAMLADPVNKVFTAARAMDMVGPDWVWIGSQIWVESPMDPVVPDGVIGCLGYTNVSNPIYKRFYNKWQDLYTSQPNTTWNNALPIPVSPFVCDVLFGFRALNELHKRNQSLTSANVLASLRSTTMLGATSEIELDANGERVAAYNLMNYVTQADGKRAWVQVGNVWPTGVELTSTVHWTSGRTSTPVDVPTVRRVPRQVSVAASTTVIVLASFGILVTAIVLAFNVHYRDLTFIKMSSPIFNNVILVGVIVGFVYIIVLGVSNGTNCLVRVALLSFAFSMCFGGLFIKTYRVAAIFNTGAEAKVVKIKNRLLFAYMGALIAIDVVIICVWAIVDPITTLVTNLPSIPDDLDPDNSIVQPYISRCNSVHYDTFLGTIYGVKGIIIIWGAFLSARTSHVTIPALNDSKQIGLAIYTTGLISLSIVPGLEFLSPEQVTVQFIMASMAVIAGLFANIAILFVPKIQAVISGRHAKLTKTQAITNDFATRKPTTTPTPHT